MAQSDCLAPLISHVATTLAAPAIPHAAPPLAGLSVSHVAPTLAESALPNAALTFAAPSITHAAPKKKCVTFGHAIVRTFAMTIDDSKLPSDGLSPLGLGEALDAEVYPLDAYEAARSAERPQLADMSDEERAQLPDATARRVDSRRGVRVVSDFERRGILVGWLGDEDPEEKAVLEAVEASNRAIRGQNVTVYERDDAYDIEEESGWADGQRYSLSGQPHVPLYATADEDASRDGIGGGFDERDEEEEDRRKARALEERAATETRKAERRRCAGCKRFACIC